MRDVLRLALEYAKRGYRVVPVRPRDKRPLLKAWPELATTDSVKIQGWFARGSNNVGIACGAQSKLFVLDVDGDPRRLLGHRELPETAAQRTGGGGCQFFYKWTRELDELTTTRVGLLPKVDARGAGGFVVVPPSIHPSGRPYQWFDGFDLNTKLAPPPDWLLELLRVRPAKAKTSDDEWIAIARDGAKQGERNTTLARLAGHLLHRTSTVDPNVARELLLAWAEARCTPPLPEAEALRTINSIARKELFRQRGLAHE